MKGGSIDADIKGLSDSSMVCHVETLRFRSTFRWSLIVVVENQQTVKAHPNFNTKNFSKLSFLSSLSCTLMVAYMLSMCTEKTRAGILWESRRLVIARC